MSLRYSTLTESGTCPASHSPRGRMSITGVPCFCAATTSWGAMNLTCKARWYLLGHDEGIKQPWKQSDGSAADLKSHLMLCCCQLSGRML